LENRGLERFDKNSVAINQGLKELGKILKHQRNNNKFSGLEDEKGGLRNLNENFEAMKPVLRVLKIILK
jgi:hypothetical protein